MHGADQSNCLRWSEQQCDSAKVGFTTAAPAAAAALHGAGRTAATVHEHSATAAASIYGYHSTAASHHRGTCYTSAAFQHRGFTCYISAAFHHGGDTSAAEAAHGAAGAAAGADVERQHPAGASPPPTGAAPHGGHGRLHPR